MNKKNLSALFLLVPTIKVKFFFFRKNRLYLDEISTRTELNSLKKSYYLI